MFALSFVTTVMASSASDHDPTRDLASWGCHAAPLESLHQTRYGTPLEGGQTARRLGGLASAHLMD